MNTLALSQLESSQRSSYFFPLERGRKHIQVCVQTAIENTAVYFKITVLPYQPRQKHAIARLQIDDKKSNNMEGISLHIALCVHQVFAQGICPYGEPFQFQFFIPQRIQTSYRPLYDIEVSPPKKLIDIAIDTDVSLLTTTSPPSHHTSTSSLVVTTREPILFDLLKGVNLALLGCERGDGILFHIPMVGARLTRSIAELKVMLSDENIPRFVEVIQQKIQTKESFSQLIDYLKTLIEEIGIWSYVDLLTWESVKTLLTCILNIFDSPPIPSTPASDQFIIMLLYTVSLILLQRHQKRREFDRDILQKIYTLYRTFNRQIILDMPYGMNAWIDLLCHFEVEPQMDEFLQSIWKEEKKPSRNLWLNGHEVHWHLLYHMSHRFHQQGRIDDLATYDLEWKKQALQSHSSVTNKSPSKKDTKTLSDIPKKIASNNWAKVHPLVDAYIHSYCTVTARKVSEPATYAYNIDALLQVLIDHPTIPLGHLETLREKIWSEIIKINIVPFQFDCLWKMGFLLIQKNHIHMMTFIQIINMSSTWSAFYHLDLLKLFLCINDEAIKKSLICHQLKQMPKEVCKTCQHALAIYGFTLN